MTNPKQNNKADFNKAWQAIRQAEKIFMTTHEGTDGDDLGSLLALRSVLKKMGKEVHPIIKGGIPHVLRFLPGSDSVTQEFEARPYDLVITFGCNKISRPGYPELEQLPATKINFDHHPDNGLFGDINIVDPSTAAVAELIYYFLKDNPEVEFDREIATCLLTGIFTDTGGFQHSNTTSEVLAVAAELMKRGARIDKIAHETFGTKRPQAMKAWSKALDNTRFDPEKKMAFSVMTAEDIAETGAEDSDMTGFVQILNHIPQAKFSLFLRQHGDEVKGSLRSEPHKDVDVSEIAKIFGGGGHKYASGFKIKGKLIRGDKGWRIES